MKHGNAENILTGAMRAILKRCMPVLLLISSGRVWACPVENPVVDMTVNGHALAVEVASNRDGHMCGLAFRDHLPADHGMLFAFGSDRILAFWMKDTYMPLSIAYLDADGRILEIHQMEPRDTARRYVSTVPARYALEVNQGWFASKSIKAGDRLELVFPGDVGVYRYQNPVHVK